MKKTASEEKERDEAKEEDQVARLAVIAAGDAKEKVEGDLAKVQDALVATEEAKAVSEKAKHKDEAEVASLEVEKMSLLLEIGASKEEISSLYSQAGKDKEAMEEDYHKALEVIFAYGYKCCAFKHNIYADQPEVLDGVPESSDPLPPKFFVSPRCPPVPAATKDTAVKAHPSEVAKEPKENAFVGDQS